ncbi:MAG TPA: hypothetical protein VK629_19540 [Steroidobacteraceae bacterium]|nr:hypothetical protein [Steroidobacteraceae bacterium]
MTFLWARQATELLLGLALLQHSLEHCAVASRERPLFIARAVLALLLAASVTTTWFSPRWIELALLLVSVLILTRFRGPYNGGADRMGYLILLCLCLSRWLPEPRWQEAALGYLAVQLTLSYAASGWVKIVNADWRSGVALTDVFRFSAYPASESLRGWSHWPRLLLTMSWLLMLFEILFPLAVLNTYTLYAALAVAIALHLVNAFLFGLNRFLWIWIAAYPSILWLQQRLIAN